MRSNQRLTHSKVSRNCSMTHFRFFRLGIFSSGYAYIHFWKLEMHIFIFGYIKKLFYFKFILASGNYLCLSKVQKRYGTFKWQPPPVPESFKPGMNLSECASEDSSSWSQYEMTKENIFKYLKEWNGERRPPVARPVYEMKNDIVYNSVPDTDSRAKKKIYRNGMYSQIRFEKKLRHEYVPAEFPYYCPRIAPLLAATERGIDLTRVDFVLGGSILVQLAFLDKSPTSKIEC